MQKSIHLESSNQPCLLGPLPEVRIDSGRFYGPWNPLRGLVVEEADKTLVELTVGHLTNDKLKRIKTDGVLWRFARHLSVDWQFAPGDPRYRDRKARRPVSTRHIHAGFRFAGHDLHVDYVMFMSAGPLMGTEEFMVFIDGVLKARGGYFACFGMSPRSWPLAVRFGSQLLLFEQGFDGGPDLSKFKGMSLWVRDQTTGDEPTGDSDSAGLLR